MELYCGIDLHSNNSVVVIQDRPDHRVVQVRLRNDLGLICQVLAPYQASVVGVVVESTFNGYWLVDGLQEEGYRVHLAHTPGNKAYEGLKYVDDFADAGWLAQLLQLGILAEGYIYPKEERAVRDLLRKRSQLVQQRTRQILSIQSQIARHTGGQYSGNRIKKLTAEEVSALFPNAMVALAVQSNLQVMACLDEQIRRLERVVQPHIRDRRGFKNLLTVNGIGKTLGWTILLETGEIHRFRKVGQFASYSRCVDAKRLSNGKKKGDNNAKNGNRYLAWAFVEAANFAVRYSPKIQRYYQRKKAKKNGVVAIKAVAHKLARACYYIMRDDVPFDVDRAFS